MPCVNPNYSKLQAGYLFPEIARRTAAFLKENPGAEIIRMGIGDVVLPLPQAVCEAMKKAVEEMGTPEGFRGYGPEQGYGFLREAIAAEFALRGAEIDPSEIFVSDGSKCDTGNFQELFGADARIAVTDPVYPVYVDTNVMAGRTGKCSNGSYEGLVYLPTTAENGFAPELPKERVDVVYLCSPNNPTGAVMTRAQLKTWVDWAAENDATILFDAAYEAFIRDPEIPHSIFEIEGARKVAVEFRSFSKHAGFTGVRCGYVVVPKESPFHAMWNRRHCTKFNGVSYPVQRGAEAVFSPEGRRQCMANIDYYMENARLVRETLSGLGVKAHGGENGPYVWMETPGREPSWNFFDRLLREANVVGTPGAGFGACGEGYFRLSAFALRENVERALERVKRVL